MKYVSTIFSEIKINKTLRIYIYIYIIIIYFHFLSFLSDTERFKNLILKERAEAQIINDKNTKEKKTLEPLKFSILL